MGLSLGRDGECEIRPRTEIREPSDHGRSRAIETLRSTTTLNRAAFGFSFSDRRYDCRVKLEFTIDHEIGPLSA